MRQIDIKGPFTIDGKRMSALIISDDHSGFHIILYTFSFDKKPRMFLQIYHDVSLYGIPKKVLVNHGSQFKNNV